MRRWEKGSGKGQSPDSHAAVSPGNPFPFPLTPAASQSTSAPLPLPAPAPLPASAPAHCQVPHSPHSHIRPLFPPIFQNFLLFFSHLTISGLSSLAKEPRLWDLGCPSGLLSELGVSLHLETLAVQQLSAFSCTLQSRQLVPPSSQVPQFLPTVLACDIR